jgi:hypothetical protein
MSLPLPPVPEALSAASPLPARAAPDAAGSGTRGCSTWNIGGRFARWSRREGPMLAAFLAVSVAWSWPLARDPAGTMVSLHFDQFPVAWLADAARSFLPDGASGWSAWPAGEPLQRVDSYVFLGVAALLGGAIPGMLLANLFVLLGPVASAWTAAQFTKRALGGEGAEEARDRVPRAGEAGGRVAPFVAGVLYGFGPMALVAALEGQVYTLLAPWLPLAALAAWEGRAGRTALHVALATLTTAYLGVDAVLAVGGILLVRLPVLGWARVARVLAAVGAFGLAFAGWFATGEARAPGPVEGATLTTLLAGSPWLDLARHSLGPALGMVPLALGWMALVDGPAGGSGRRVRVGLALLGLVAALASVGPRLELGVVPGTSLPGPLAAFTWTGMFNTIRFPLRLAWVCAFAWGALAATWIGEARWRPVWVVAALVDVLVAGGAHARLRGHPVPVPTLYGLLPQGAVLDLVPELGGPREDLGFLTQNLHCHYQRAHRRPVLERCLNTDLERSPRVAASREVHALLLGGAPAGEVRDRLGALRVSSVVVHADLYAPGELAEVTGGLSAALGPPLAEGRDGGEWLLAWRTDAMR